MSAKTVLVGVVAFLVSLSLGLAVVYLGQSGPTERRSSRAEKAGAAGNKRQEVTVAVSGMT